ncbi:hypothetical protein D3C81_1004020 [compost metagenome]
MDTYNFLRAYDRERTEALRPDSRETAENGPSLVGRMASIDSGMDCRRYASGWWHLHVVLGAEAALSVQH